MEEYRKKVIELINQVKDIHILKLIHEILLRLSQD